MLNKILFGLIVALCLGLGFFYYSNKKLIASEQSLKDAQTLLVKTNNENVAELNKLKKDADEKIKVLQENSNAKEIVYVKTTKFVKEIADKPLPVEYSCPISPDVISALSLMLKMDIENE